MVRALAAAFLVLAVAAVDGRRAQLTLDQRAIEEALALGRSRLEIELSRFHEPYRLVVSKPPIDIVHVVTPFRRVVLAAEERARRGESSFGQREAILLLTETAGRIDLYLELTFHPLNTFIGVPDYSVVLLAPGKVEPIPTDSLDRLPRYGPRLEGLPTTTGPPLARGSGPMLGATVIARFDGTRLDPNGAYDVVMSERGKELARGRINLERLR